MNRRRIFKLLGGNTFAVVAAIFLLGPGSPIGLWVGDPFTIATWLTWHAYLVWSCCIGWIIIHARIYNRWLRMEKEKGSDWNAKLEVQKYLEKKDG